MSERKAKQKHDGKLGKKRSVTRVVSSQSLWLSINDHEFGKSVGLQPSEALSLLAWLRQEEATLEQWAKDQEA